MLMLRARLISFVPQSISFFPFSLFFVLTSFEQIKVKAYLTGMPDCKFGMNDKILMEHEVAQGKKHRRTTGFEFVK